MAKRQKKTEKYVFVIRVDGDPDYVAVFKNLDDAVASFLRIAENDDPCFALLSEEKELVYRKAHERFGHWYYILSGLPEELEKDRPEWVFYATLVCVPLE